MTMTRQFPAANLVMPMGLSGLLAAAAVAGGGWALPPAEEGAALGMLQRLFGNPFVVLIGFVGFWAFFFGLIQLWAFQSGGPLVARLAGHSGVAPNVMAASDANLTAALFTERWDHLAAIRMAPLSYAIWALPLLGFIGTVIGISDAIGDLGSVFADGDRQEALGSVLGALQFAFDTTFAGLVLVMPVMALATTVSLRADAARDAALADNFGAQAAG